MYEESKGPILSREMDCPSDQLSKDLSVPDASGPVISEETSFGSRPLSSNISGTDFLLSRIRLHLDYDIIFAEDYPFGDLHVIKASSIREDMLQSVRVRAMPDIVQHGCNLWVSV